MKQNYPFEHPLLEGDEMVQWFQLPAKQKVLSQDRIWKKCSFQIQNWIILICLIPGPMQVKGIVDASKVVLRTLLDEYLPGGGRISEAV